MDRDENNVRCLPYERPYTGTGDVNGRYTENDRWSLYAYEDALLPGHDPASGTQRSWRVLFMTAITRYHRCTHITLHYIISLCSEDCDFFFAPPPVPRPTGFIITRYYIENADFFSLFM